MRGHFFSMHWVSGFDPIEPPPRRSENFGGSDCLPLAFGCSIVSWRGVFLADLQTLNRVIFIIAGSETRGPRHRRLVCTCSRVVMKRRSFSRII